MALRFTVQGDNEQETAAGLELLLTRELTGDRWMARAVPATTKAPAEERPGPS